MIIPEHGGFSVKAESGKHLGGPYKTRGEAESRLAQVEYFKHADKTKEAKSPWSSLISK